MLKPITFGFLSPREERLSSDRREKEKFQKFPNDAGCSPSPLPIPALVLRTIFKSKVALQRMIGATPLSHSMLTKSLFERRRYVDLEMRIDLLNLNF